MALKNNSLVAGLLMATMLVAPVASIAQDKPEKPKTPASADKPAPTTRAIPFRGTVAAVDKEAKTVKVGERVFHVSPETKLTKGNQSATVAEITVGELISGNYTKGDDGKLTAKMMRIGAKVDSAEQPDKKSKATEKNAKPDAQ